MTIDEKVRKTLVEIDVNDAAGVEALFVEVRAGMVEERSALVTRGAPSKAEHEKLCKDLRDRWLARKNGLLTQIDEHWLKLASKELKPSVGRQFNELRKASSCMEIGELAKEIRVAGDSARPQAAAGQAAISEDYWHNPNPPVAPSDKQPLYLYDQGKGGRFGSAQIADLTLPGNRRPLGTLHPVTQMQREIEEIFLNLGFRIETGPEIESVYYNFDALNIPESHPSRDDWDTLYIDSKTVLRTHTSPVQIRSMEKYGAPLYIIIPGKCYRHDNPDASHSPMFHQIEGLAIASDITFADLKGTLDFFAKKLFGEKIRTRFQPSFFPFTEPSGEVSISCIFCGGEGCRVCKESGWIEVMGCGMVHPQVLRNGGIDPEKYTGWAFGLGIDRFAMMKYDINDIQLFFQSDVRFLGQF
ncbi:MAG: phenylalanine--tRNA ligase subunit alpha [Terriglobia bacterium]|jgi:phenylalanyl-tRNA synthetase alpha chain